jgi:chromosome segregation ATPase
MAFDTSQSKEIDLDSTDKLPILEGISIDEDVEDDSVRLDYSASAATAVVASQPAGDFRAVGVDLPSLAESVRTVEERIARQNADYEALNKLYERARDAQLTAGTRADTLAAELTAAQSALAVEQHRLREMQRMVAETNAATEQTRARVEEALRDAERAQTEARTLRDSLVSRDTSIAQALHSLGERDAQLSALQREHAKIVPDLEARSRASVILERELAEARGRAEALALDLKASRQSVSDLMTRMARGESELNGNRRELGSVKTLANSYLEILKSRDWRSGFNQNLFREWDEKIDAAQSGRGALQVECDQLTQSAAALNAKIAEQDETIAKLNAAKAGDAAALAKRAQGMQELERARADLVQRVESLEAERARLQGELAAGGQAIAEARAQGAGEAKRIKELLAAAEGRQAELTTQLEQLQAEAVTHEEEVTVLMAHLHEARRPTQSIQADLKRLTDELALKTLSVDQLTEDNRALRATLERTRGALEERELLIRRLERSASNNANVLGRLQTSIERLGTTPAPSAGPPPSEYTAELVRMDGGQQITFPLARRTRIGRAPGCELQIDSQSVSRNHALILKAPRELIVEDLNSTNGVLVNGKKISRHLLSDGDVLTIGEIQFRCVMKPLVADPPVLEAGVRTGSNLAAPTSVPNVADLRPAEPPKPET